MTTILGIESTAHTFGIGVVKNGKILSNVRDMYVTEKGGIIPMESAKHHARIAEEVYKKSLIESGINEKDIDAIAFSQGPGLAPCLLEGIRFAKNLSQRLNNLSTTTPTTTPKNINDKIGSSLDVNLISNKSRAKRDKFKFKEIPLVPVNHCVAHLEIGKITGAKDPVMLYASGANTQIIGYEAGKYRVFGETLDVGIGNFIDTFARYLGLGFPGGPKIEELAKKSQNYIELPYTVKGMDIALSGILTNLKQKIDRLQIVPPLTPTTTPKNINNNPRIYKLSRPIKPSERSERVFSRNKFNSQQLSGGTSRVNYTKEDLAFSLQETVFAMLVEVSERALAHTGKKEFLLAGGVACNKRLQEMCKIMCKERGAKFFVPEKPLLVDNGAMIGFLGEVMFNAGIGFKEKYIDKLDILPRQRTDDVDVSWK